MVTLKRLKKKLSQDDEFWCDLAITLGKTVGELQESITEAEYELWLRYRYKFGPMNMIRMYDRPAALLSTIISNVYGGKRKPDDFLPYGKEDEDVVLEADDFVNLLVSTGAKIGRE